MHVLLVEDDALLADGICRLLGDHGMAVAVAHDGAEAETSLQTGGLSVMVLDIGLPGTMDGFEVLRRLRARGSNLPVMLLTARGAVEDRVRGLETGADDYLAKPFATPELVARLQALVRRANAAGGHLQLGWLSLDVLAKRGRIGESVIELSVREWTVLEYLMRNASRVVSKQQIIDAILPGGEEMTANAVEVYVSRIRLKIAGSGAVIRTIRGFGYIMEEEAK